MKTDVADIWTINLDVSDEILSQYLCDLREDEKYRSEQFRRSEDRINFIVSRAVLKRLIASRIAVPVSEIIFKKNKFGKPQLKDYQKLQFNLSHSGKVGVIGFTKNSRIGVDVELMKEDLEFESMAKHHFSAEEYQLLLQQSGKRLRDYFYRCWTRKEALIKAEGSGISYPLDSFVVSMDSSDTAEIISFKDATEMRNWSIHTFAPRENYVAAVVINQGRSRLEHFSWDHSRLMK